MYKYFKQYLNGKLNNCFFVIYLCVYVYACAILCAGDYVCI